MGKGNRNRLIKPGKDIGPMKNVRVTPVDEGQPFGVYVWICSNGKRLASAPDTFLSIAGIRNDIVAMAKMRDAAMSIGRELNDPTILNGYPAFLPGRKKVSDEVYEDQTAQMLEGQINDMDLGAILDAQKENRD